MAHIYNGKFRVSQIQNPSHNGLDMVGLDSKVIYSNVNGVVEIAGWENPNNTKQGFGKYVRIKKDGSTDKYYYGHLDNINVWVGQKVKIGDKIGTEGATGDATGSHCHFCVRVNGDKNKALQAYSIIGIPNILGAYKGIIGIRPSTGNYVVTATSLNVRTGPGTNYRIKNLTELTKDAQRQGGYKKGVIFTARSIHSSEDGKTLWWAKTPSGYVCLIGENSEIYANKK